MELLSVTMNDGVVKRSQIEGKDNSSEDKSNYKIVRSGDLVYNSMRMWQGANGISKYDGIVSPAYTVLKAVEEIDEGYFAALFKTVKLINEFRKNSQGLTSDTWNLKYPQIAGIRICIPKIGEQHKISSFLQFLDKRIDAQRRFVENLKLYKRGVLKRLFNTISNFRKLNEISEYVTSNLSLENIKKYKMGIYPVYDAGGVSTYINKYKMSCDYIAIIKDGSGVGKLQYCIEKSSFIGTLGGIVAKNCNIGYLYAAMQMIDFRGFITGATIPHVYYKDYGNIKIPFPNTDIQCKINNISKLLDKKITTAETNLNNNLKLKAALLQNLFI